jgi:lipase chaperone LimK
LSSFFKFFFKAAEKRRKKLEMEKLAKMEERKLREEEVRAKKAALADQGETPEMQEREDDRI